MGSTRNLAEVIRRKLAGDEDLAAAVEAERFNLNVGSAIFEARTSAGLTQQQLADRIGMHQSAIARLEDADYDGHSLKTLERIAAALGKRLEIRFAEQSTAQQPSLTEEFDIEAPTWEEGVETWSPMITIAGKTLHPTGSLVP
jgi:transcriptional regulator with XRE-family HTH domain